MDWARVKTTLIVILLSLNVMLIALYIYNTNTKSSYKVSEKTIEELVSRLKKDDINLEADIPATPKDTRPLIVKYQEEKPLEINNKFFLGQGKVDIDADIYKISHGEEEITVINNRRLLYENFGAIEDTGEEITVDVAFEFLKEKGFSTDDLYLKKFVVNGNFGEIEFAKTYKNKIIETSYTRMIIEHGHIITMDRLWIEIVEEDLGNIEIDPAYKALFSLIGRDDLKGTTIENIDMCYYFNPEEQGILEDNTRAEKGRAIPAWRIGLKGGEFLIVDNY